MANGFRYEANEKRCMMGKDVEEMNRNYYFTKYVVK